MQTVQKLEGEIKKVKKHLIEKAGGAEKKDLSSVEGSLRKKLKRLQRRRRVLKALDDRIAGAKAVKAPAESKPAATEAAAGEKAAKAPSESKPAATEAAAGEKAVKAPAESKPAATEAAAEKSAPEPKPAEAEEKPAES